MHIASAMASASIALFFVLCYEQPDAPPPALETCLTPDVWIGMTCGEWCANGNGVCHEGDSVACHDATVVAYTRQDACWVSDEFHNVVLPQRCDDPLPETLTDSIYFVQCCCYEP